MGIQKKIKNDIMLIVKVGDSVKNKKMNIKSHLKIFILTLLSFTVLIGQANADSITGTINADQINFRSGPGTGNSSYGYLYLNTAVTVLSTTLHSGAGCNAGWFNIYYNNQNGYVCSTYINIAGYDVYDRPWTSPKKSIVGGAKFLSLSYIGKGQNTTYLQKFQVNHGAAYPVYTHQYMANLAAPVGESWTTYNSYKNNNLLSLPLEFYIPIYTNMPEQSATQLPNQSTDLSGQDYSSDQAFEDALNAQGFSESYKRKIRLLHNQYPNWIFKALHTNLDFYYSVNQEQKISSIQKGNTALYENPHVETEPGWYLANTQTVAYYLDPRNFLMETKIFMFEDLSYSENYNQSVVQSILGNTFMTGYSFLDNQLYSDIFVEAGRTANISAVHLASRARQESGVNVSNTTDGRRFEYEGITYEGFYNFFNIGAYGCNTAGCSPALRGLVYASKGAAVDENGVVNGTNNNGGNENPNPPIETPTTDAIIGGLGATRKGNYLVGIIQNNQSQSPSVRDFKNRVLANITVRNSAGNEISGNELLGTGMTVTINGEVFTIIVYGDMNGDGKIDTTDLLRLKNHILGSRLNGAYLEASKLNASGVETTYLLGLRRHLLKQEYINQR